MTKALAEGTNSAGGYLVDPQISAEVVKLIRARSAVMRMNPRVVPVEKQLLVASISSGATAYYVAENAAITPSEESFAQAPLLAPKELATLVPISNRLLRDAAGSPDVEQVIREDLAEVLALREDLAFLQGTGASGEPLGIINTSGLSPAPSVAEWRRRGGDLGIQRVSETPGDEFVTAVDHASEEAIRAALHRATPGIPVVGELHAEAEVDDQLVWVVDPVDGTTNLVNGDPFVSVTIALLESGQPIVGATGCPFTGELWSAMSGQGAHDSDGITLDIRGRATSRTIALDPKTYAETWQEAVKRLESAYFDVRPLASIALELARVANGDFDGFVALGQPGGSSILDFAAGILLIREAGGDVIGLDGRSDAWTSEAVLAGNAETLERLRECMVDFKVRVPEA